MPDNSPLPPPPEDPAGENPCPKGHPAHKIWDDATNDALEDHFRLNQLMLERNPTPTDLPSWAIELFFRRFQIWAKRNLTIVRNRADAIGYAKWLDSYLEATIATACEKPPFIEVELRSQLTRAANYWKSHAFKQIRPVTEPSERHVSEDRAADEFTFFKELRPLGANPYPPEGVPWRRFEEATYEAKGQLDSLWAKYRQNYASTVSHAEVLALILVSRLERLDVITEMMLQTIVTDAATAESYENWLADTMRAEKTAVLDLVYHEKPQYGELFNEESFTHELVLKQQQYKKNCDSQTARLIREGMAASNGEVPERSGADVTKDSPSPTVVATEEPLPKTLGTDVTLADERRRARAAIVAKLIKELDSLRPRMFGDETRYTELATEFPNYLSFKIACENSDLKKKLLAIQDSLRHFRLAQELAAAHHGRAFATIQDDWKRHKPAEFRYQK